MTCDFKKDKRITVTNGGLLVNVAQKQVFCSDVQQFLNIDTLIYCMI